MTTNTHGGKREGAGRKQKATKAKYLRIPIAEPQTDEQWAAIEWWEAWSPADRLAYITDLHYDCGNKPPINKRKAP